MATRLALDLGLHIDTSALVLAGKMTTKISRARRMAFWGTYLNDQYVIRILLLRHILLTSPLGCGPSTWEGLLPVKYMNHLFLHPWLTTVDLSSFGPPTGQCQQKSSITRVNFPLVPRHCLCKLL